MEINTQNERSDEGVKCNEKGDLFAYTLLMEINNQLETIEKIPTGV